ncbi:hypothetical protein KJ068_11235 [bacterium]|nr:hypothetical protein [bacterium]
MIDDYLKEAREIAARAGYRLVLADIHLFCAEALLEQQKANGKKQPTQIYFWVRRLRNI